MTHTDDVLQSSLAVALNNRTIVAYWDLARPLALIRPIESVNPKGDLRRRVPDADFTANGKYGAICKVVMNYISRPNDPREGTGWLISPTLIVTAGHCCVHQGRPLNYVRVHFGYAGPESVGNVGTTYRYGIRVAMPAEYLRVREPDATHDVAFIVLNEAVTDISPIKYVDTPTKRIETRLAVVGYPSDDHHRGNFMYEEWIDGEIDIIATNGLLEYEINTSTGQSGSPVLMSDASTDEFVAGVHVQAGSSVPFRNIGSVIGPAGNNFDEFILALKVANGEESSLAWKADDQTVTSFTVPWFSVMHVEARASKESAQNTMDLTGDASVTSNSSEDSNEDSDMISSSDDDGTEGTRRYGVHPRISAA